MLFKAVLIAALCTALILGTESRPQPQNDEDHLSSLKKIDKRNSDIISAHKITAKELVTLDSEESQQVDKIVGLADSGIKNIDAHLNKESYPDCCIG